MSGCSCTGHVLELARPAGDSSSAPPRRTSIASRIAAPLCAVYRVLLRMHRQRALSAQIRQDLLSRQDD